MFATTIASHLLMVLSFFLVAFTLWVMNMEQRPAVAFKRVIGVLTLTGIFFLLNGVHPLVLLGTGLITASVAKKAVIHAYFLTSSNTSLFVLMPGLWIAAAGLGCTSAMMAAEGKISGPSLCVALVINGIFAIYGGKVVEYLYKRERATNVRAFTTLLSSCAVGFGSGFVINATVLHLLRSVI